MPFLNCHINREHRTVHGLDKAVVTGQSDNPFGTQCDRLETFKISVSLTQSLHLGIGPKKIILKTSTKAEHPLHKHFILVLQNMA